MTTRNNKNYWTFSNVTLVPFVKWVGGKRQIIEKYLKDYIPSFNRYIEPFVGGGAVFLYLKPSVAIINDSNESLMHSYKSIKDEPLKLMNSLDRLSKKHSEEFYYSLRNKKFRKYDSIASQLIYLNKTCFNGIYRVNAKGEFNVPLNKGTLNKKINLYDYKNICALSTYFNSANIEFYSKDYLDILSKAEKGDFIFCDPPYDYEINQKGFAEYTKSGFNQENQKQLAQALLDLDKKGIKWLLTNHDTKLIRELYYTIDNHIKIVEITTNRFINSDPTKRIGTGKEVMIFNYEK